MKLNVTTSIAALLIASSAIASSYDTSRGAQNDTVVEEFNMDSDGYLYTTDGVAIVDVDGDPVQMDLTRRAAGSDDTALMGVDDKGDIMASRGADNRTSMQVATNGDGTMTDEMGRYFVDITGDVIRVDWAALAETSAGADPTATMGVDDEEPITASRGADMQTAPEAIDD